MNLKPTAATAIPREAVAVMVKLGGFGNRRKLGSDAFSVDADKGWVGATKKLFECPELTRIETVKKRVGHYMLTWNLPSCFKRGVYLVPVSKLNQCIGALTELRNEWDAAIAAFGSAYEQRKAESKLKLRGNYRDSDYMKARDLEQQFYFEWNFVSFEVPGALSLVSGQAYEAERAKAAAAWAEAVESARVYVRAQLLKLVETLAEKLRKYGCQAQKTIRDNALDDVKEFIAAFSARNEITDDAQLQSLVARMDRVVRGIDVEMIRDSESTRAYVSQRFNDFGATLTSLVAERPKRMIAWED